MLELFESEEARLESCAPGSATFVHWGAICREVNDSAIQQGLKDADVAVTGQEKAELSQYIVSNARILFAIAHTTGALRIVPKLPEFRLTDDYLPIVWDKTQHRAKSLMGAPQGDKALEWFSPTHFGPSPEHSTWIKNFCRAQWEYLAPVFTDTEITSTPHWKAIRRPGESADAVSNGTGVNVAIKKITKQHEATDMWVQVEVAALELVRSLHHPHLINFLTSYRQGGNHYLVFDWANGGDLRTFWTTTSPEPRQPGDLSHRETIIWAANQIAGLASGLHKLHTEDKHGLHCRHGDLKPANIVRSTTDRDMGAKSHGRLLITDMGVAKINDKATHVGRSSGNLKATIRYQSPEFLFRASPDSPTSRAYDMWSMGCTLLEFIIWLLYGPSQIKAFNDSFPNTTFFSRSPKDGIGLNSAVTYWVNHLKNGPLSEDETHCVSGALRDILDFTLQRLLIRDVRPELENPAGDEILQVVVTAPTDPAVDMNGEQTGCKRAKSKELLEKLEAVCRTEDLSYFLREPPNGKKHFLAPPLARKFSLAAFPEGNPNMSSGNSLQVPASEVQGAPNLLSWDRLQPRFADLPQGQAHLDQPYVTDYLRDSWDAMPDNELALQLFPEIALTDILPANTTSASATTLLPSTHSMGLCSRCSNESSGIFSLRFVFEEDLEDLKKKERQCGVCQTLRQHALKSNPPPQRVKFLRSGSYLVQSSAQDGIAHKPIFSLVVGPGITSVPKDLQRSFPRLPQVVTQPGREAAGTPKPRPQLTVSGDEAMFVIIKKWIEDCDKKHIAQNKDQPNCNPSRPSLRLPTRLIYLGQGAATKIYLKCRRETNDKQGLGDYGDEQDRGLKYIALSHRWGYPRGDPEWTITMPDGSQRVKDFCTTDDNIDAFKDSARGIDFAAMPKTFRDAIEVTRGLGIEYLWIDSLCIIQNQPDKKDFKAEAPRMRDVYNGAYCTIASTRAWGTTDGFLNKRTDRSCVRIDTVRRVLGPNAQGSSVDENATIEKKSLHLRLRRDRRL